VITSKQKKFLRGLAHSLDPYIIIGKNGLSDSALNSISKSLTDHELIKIKVKIGAKNELGPKIEKMTNSTIVGSIGKILILYKKNENNEESKILLP
tara:strand:+ start:95 stop:382 length:288 start_codon:yes stop_codon:yes gene_type:complete